jgi:hypothetical protein
MKTLQLAKLLPEYTPESVLAEVHQVVKFFPEQFPFQKLDDFFAGIQGLYSGHWPGYQACNTEYHDFRHVMDVLLAAARLLHGVTIHGWRFSDRATFLCLAAAMLHDAGYIQEADDMEGTGSKYTATHVQRSCDFVHRHRRDFGFSESESRAVQDMIACTDLAVKPKDIEFRDKETERLGLVLAAADLLAQMADRTYLEKLLFLYQEFKEAGIGDIADEQDLLQKTLTFYTMIDRRLAVDLMAVDRFMIGHFAARWNIPMDLYRISIEKQRSYLEHILSLPDEDPREHLRRSVSFPGPGGEKGRG